MISSGTAVSGVQGELAGCVHLGVISIPLEVNAVGLCETIWEVSGDRKDVLGLTHEWLRLGRQGGTNEED